MSVSASRNPLLHWLENLAGALTSVLFPAGCRLCDRLLTDARRLPVCRHCLGSFARVLPGSCELCGRPGTFDPEFPNAPSLCHDCEQGRFAFQFARSFGLYEGALVRAILLLKHERIEPLGTWFASRLAEVVRSEGDRLAADLIVPVPLHRLRARERGFNQVDVFGRPLARLLRLPYKPVLLMRSRPRPEKHLLRLDERWEAVRGAFAIRHGGRVDNLRVLLLDDVMTTGATLDACSRALREAGAKSVLGLTEGHAMTARRPEAIDPRGRYVPEAGGLLVPGASGNIVGRHVSPLSPHRASLMQEPVLVLNATYEPINVTAVRRAMVLLLKGVAQAEEMHSAEVHSATHTHKVPSVIRLLAYRHIPQQSRALSRKNILLRDRNTCQFCGRIFPSSELTLDHVLPRSRGGRSTWENLVACCYRCNNAKGDRTPEEAGLKLARRPRPFTLHTSRQLMRLIGHRDERWRKYLFY